MTGRENEAQSAQSQQLDGPTRREWRSLWNVMAVQTQNAFNDKVAQFVLIAVAAVFLEGVLREQFRHLVSVILSLPFVLFAPLAGWISDRFSKRNVVVGCVLVQIIVIISIAVAFRAQWFWAATAGFLLLAIQSTFFSPAKVGIVKELVGTNRLAMASGWAQMLTILAIILGSLVGGHMFEILEAHLGKWDAAFYTTLGISGLAVIPIICGLLVQKTPAVRVEPLRPRVLIAHFFHLKELLTRRGQRLTAVGIAYFWFSGSLLALIVLQMAAEVASKPSAEAAIASTMLGYAGIGIALGSVFVALVSSHRIELGLIPIGGLGMGFTAFAGSILQPTETLFSSFNLNLLLLGMSSAIFLVPLNALLQDLVDPRIRGRMLSASALLDSTGAILAIGVQWIFLVLDIPPALQLFTMGVMSLLVGFYVIRIIPQNFVRFIVSAALRTVYRIRPVNAHHIPKEGGALLIANHLSYIDSLIISAAVDRPVRFVVFDHYITVKWMVWFLKLFGVIPISATRARDAIRTTADVVKAGDLVCIFPEGQLTRTGMLNELKKGFELIVRRADAPVVPLYLDGVWRSIFSFERGRFFKKKPYHLPYHVTVYFGTPLDPKEVSGNRAREIFMDLAADALAVRKELMIPVEIAVLHALKRQSWKTAMVDPAEAPKPVTRAVIYATALQLAKRFRSTIPQEESRVAVLLPNCSTSVIMNIALRLSGKVPINVPLERTHDREPLRQVMKAAGIRTAVSSGKLPEEFQSCWPGKVLDVDEELRALSNFGRWLEGLGTYLTPKFRLWQKLAVKPDFHDPASAAVGYLADRGDGRLALIEISHRDLMANIEKLNDTNIYREGDILLSAEPFGSAVGTILSLWYPLFRGMPSVILPLEAGAKELWDTIAAEEVTWLIADEAMAADTAIDKGPPEPSPLRAFLTFRDLPIGIASEIETRLGLNICRGAASEELGGLISLSMPDPHADTATASPQPGSRKGAAGRLLPGTTARICLERPDPERDNWKSISGKSGPLTKEGWIALRGAGLASSKGLANEVFRGRFDIDGFLFFDCGGAL